MHITYKKNPVDFGETIGLRDGRFQLATRLASTITIQSTFAFRLVLPNHESIATRLFRHRIFGAAERIRTPDLLITNQLLYQLSYNSMSRAAGITAQNYEVEGCARLGVERMTGIEPASSAWKADVLPLHHVRRSRPCIEAGKQ